MSRVFIGRLPHSCRERDLERFFRGFGRIREVNLKTGYAFVEFEDYKDADDAVYEMNGRDLLGERVVVELARSSRGGRVPFSKSKASRSFEKYGPPVRTDYRLTIDNLSSRTSWQDLKDFIRSFGCEVTYADAHKWRRNEGTVSFASSEDMKRAARKLDGVELDGRRLKVYENRSRSRSRSRSHHSRSRSRDSRSPRRRSRSGSRSRSRSPVDRDYSKSRSRSPSRSRSRSPDNRRERSPSNN